MNYYKFNIGDYAAATRHLTLLEHGAYRLLLDVYYTAEGPLPADIKAVARQAGARAKDEIAAVEVVLQEFFTLSEQGWQHGRCDSEISAFHAKAETNRASGKKGGRPKKATATVPENTETGNPEKTQTVSGMNPQETLTTNHKPIDDSYESSPRAARADDDTPASPGEWVEVFAAEHGVEVDHRSVHDRKKFMPLAAGWVAAGVTVGQMRQACSEARAKATEPIAWLPAYADRVLASLQAPPRAAASAAPAETFRERDERLAREKMAAFLPGIAAKGPGPAPAAASRNVIDITPATFPAIGA